jgi:hypothetical protein
MAWESNLLQGREDSNLIPPFFLGSEEGVVSKSYKVVGIFDPCIGTASYSDAYRNFLTVFKGIELVFPYDFT